MTHAEEMEARTTAGEYIAKKIRSKVKDKYKTDTVRTRKLNMAADAVRDNIKRIVSKI